MTRRFVASIAAAILLLTPCSLAQAQPKIPSLGDDTPSSSTEAAKGTITEAPSIEQVLELIKKADGYSDAEIVTSTSDNKTRAVRAKVNSVIAIVLPEFCKEGKIGFDMAIHFSGGTTTQYITDSAELFGVMMKTLFSFKPDK